MSDFSKILVVIPSLDPDKRLIEVIKNVQEKGFSDILLVDDGSAPENQHFFDEGAALGCHVLHHEGNKGKGRALKTAFEWFMAERKDALGVVTIDGDNQHHADDIAACTEVMLQQKKDSLVLGVRDFDQPNVPPKSKFGNKCTSGVFRLFCGLKVSDTQTGLRVFPRGIIPQMLQISGERFEYETNMLLVCKQADIPLVEQTIRTIYIDENATTHFHPIKDSLRIYGIIIRFFISSLLSFILDYGIFNLLYTLFRTGFMAAHRLFFATTIARVLSSVFNFTVNRKAVFHSDAPLTITICRYYILWGVQLLASFGLVKLLSGVFGEGGAIVAVLKLIVDMFLYFISFRIQQAWVFKPEKK
ncbi:MAG: bifunctional glycosyltransferase family 2/GtrA family protein [Oscillospiraceae bacterium]|nr:bifunctional glycosyltransferase family 2/GtrA family protein [Oscillospiraceae bacterium]